MNILDTIVAQKRREAARLPARPVTASGLQAAMAKRGGGRDFLGALQSPRRGGVALIAEVKRASPSAGLICADFDAVRLARQYEAAGADCLSVLTDEKFFQGSLEDLRRIRSAVKLPLLRKDFIIDARQILEAIEAGADAILLIARILTAAQLQEWHALARDAGLAALVEVHDEAEMDRALALGADLIGVNNRNLEDFTVDLALTGQLAARIPAAAREGTVVVAESGIAGRADVERLRRAGAGAVLVGESLMKNPAGIAAKIAQLLTH
ncbi:MAG TPA: indole-3-glycerol phosphate synthase TrpC [Candidatus Acidoferrum sp.]|nr:indole-3-glycerol phosphate synthase TrpC [Candidatus Acidoferrum sp.]